MNILIDTNIFIKAEPVTLENFEADGSELMVLLKVLYSLGHKIFIHPLTQEEIGNDNDESRRRIRMELYKKYPLLTNPPAFDDEFIVVNSLSVSNRHDIIDNHLLAAVYRNAVSFLLTEDKPLLKKATGLGLDQKVLDIRDGLDFFQDSTKRKLTHPSISQVRAYELDEHDPIFESLREDYGGFDRWLKDCKLNHIDTLVIKGVQGYEAVAILKKKSKGLKISTFKVVDSGILKGYGELLLRKCFEYAWHSSQSCIYLTVFPKYKQLIYFLQRNGFEEVGMKGEELIFSKRMKDVGSETTKLSSLDYFIRYGPFVLDVDAPIHIVPIRKEYHLQLFPDKAYADSLFVNVFGNTIQKAYICNSKVTGINSGDIILFYVSKSKMQIETIGIVQEVKITDNPEQLTRFVGPRTLYDYTNLEKLAKRSAMAFIFRFAYHLQTPIEFDILIEKKVLKSWPQQIQTVKNKDGLKWLRKRIKE